ncbi:glucoside xylosyltransferase 1-like [Tachypleus tridentatus]|uniref:glucoside xylosyltransferase 1-like n=1 Tax=Tachypleus tridentatus TaxID=6853 RepID=UPI003FD059C5
MVSSFHSKKFLFRVARLSLFLTVIIVLVMFLYKNFKNENPVIKNNLSQQGKLYQQSQGKTYKLFPYPLTSEKKGSTKYVSEKVRSHADTKNSKLTVKPSVRFGSYNVGKMTVSVVLCGDRLNQTITTLKSVVALNNDYLHFVVAADQHNIKLLKEKILDWPRKVLQKLSFEIYPVTFPTSGAEVEWRKLFKLCAAQRLFLPEILQHVDSLLYIDNDVLFLRPVADLWRYFSQMNTSQMVGMTPESEDSATGWYNRFARHPFFEPLGLNSGVMLMNLTRMREFQWQAYLDPIFKEYKLKLVWGDQDIINIIFHHHPDKVLLFGCEWNYRPDHCMYTSVCKSAERTGVAAIHGSRGAFFETKQPIFKAVFDVMSSYDLSTDVTIFLLQRLKEALQRTQNTLCGKIHSIFVKGLEDSIQKSAKATGS